MGRLARTHSDAPSITESTSTLLSPDARAAPSSSGATTAQATVGNTFVFVLKPSGVEAHDAVTSGIHCGHWKRQVLPGIVFALEQEKLPVDRKAIKDRAVRFDTFDEAVRKCESIDIAPIFMGPSPFTDDSGGSRLNVGEDVSDFLNAGCVRFRRRELRPRPRLRLRQLLARDSDHDAPTTNDERGDERDDRLGQLCAETEGYTLNTHVDILRASIARHQSSAGTARPSRRAPAAASAGPSSTSCRRYGKPWARVFFPATQRRRSAAGPTCRWARQSTAPTTPTAAVSISTHRRSAA